MEGLADLGEAALKRGKGEVGGRDRVVTEPVGYLMSIVNMGSCSTPSSLWDDLPLKAARASWISAQSEALRTRVKCSRFLAMVVSHTRGPSSIETGDMVAVVWDIYAYDWVCGAGKRSLIWLQLQVRVWRLLGKGSFEGQEVRLYSLPLWSLWGNYSSFTRSGCWFWQ